MAAPSKKSLALFVSKVPWTVARKDLGEYFGQFGASRETGFHKGHGWIAFRTEEGRDNALQKDLHVVEGATCTSAMYYYTKSCRCRDSAYQSFSCILWFIKVAVQSYRDRQRFVINKSNGDTQHD